MSYYTMHYGLLESKLFIILTKYILPERSDSQDSIFGGSFCDRSNINREIQTFVTEKCIKNLMEFGGTRWLFMVLIPSIKSLRNLNSFHINFKFGT